MTFVLIIYNIYFPRKNRAYSLKSVESSTKQLVAGMKYVIRGNFDSAANGADQVCTVNIWRRSWLGKDVVSIECDNERKFNFEINKPVDE